MSIDIGFTEQKLSPFPFRCRGHLRREYHHGRMASVNFKYKKRERSATVYLKNGTHYSQSDGGILQLNAEGRNTVERAVRAFIQNEEDENNL